MGQVVFAMVLSLTLFGWASLVVVDSFYTADDFVQLVASVPASLSDAAGFFLTDWGGATEGGTYYRPLVNVSLWMNSVITGLSPAALRVTSLLIHLAASALVTVVGRSRLGFPTPSAVLAGTFFLLLPLHDQAIYWIAARTDLLCALFYLLAFLGLTSRSLLIQLCGCIAFALALASKEMALTVPGTVGLWWIVQARDDRQRLCVAVRVGSLMSVVLVAYIAVRLSVLEGIGGDPRLLSIGPELGDHVLRMVSWSVVPFDLERLRDFARVQRMLIGPLYLFAAIILYLAIRYLRRDRRAWFALGWIALSMVPVVGAPNAWYSYIPSVGGCFLLASFCLAFPKRELAIGVIIMVVAASSLRASARLMADAGKLSQMLVYAGTNAGHDIFVVNSPIVLRGRYVVVTDQSHFDAAVRFLRLPNRTIPLNYAYIESRTDDRLSAYWDANRIIAKADVARRTFLTLDGTGVKNTSATVGASRPGVFADYLVREVARGNIASIEITPTFPSLSRSAVTVFQAGHLTLVR